MRHNIMRRKHLSDCELVGCSGRQLALRFSIPEEEQFRRGREVSMELAFFTHNVWLTFNLIIFIPGLSKQIGTTQRIILLLLLFKLHLQDL